MYKVVKIRGREILDSRGNPTVEVDVYLKGGFGRASVPSGASTGKYEAVELRDNDKRYLGKGVSKAVKNVNEVLAKKLEGKQFDQESLDKEMIKIDGTPNKSKLGANAILGISLAFAHAAADVDKISLYEYFGKISGIKGEFLLPIPMMNILNGGRHSSDGVDFQEFMIMPIGAPSFKEALRWGTEIFHNLKKILAENGLNTNVGDEGGYAPSLKSNEEALQLIVQAIEKAGYKAGSDIFIAIDAAASELYFNEKYNLKKEGKILSTSEMIELYSTWVNKYPIFSIEDPLSEDDWKGYTEITKKLGRKIQIVGDDLFVTNINRLENGIKMMAANAILIKLNQIGTVSETIEAIKMANAGRYKSIISHRSGETEDTSIADFAVGLSAGQIKTGSLSRGERTAKYNQLLRIEEILGKKAEYAGKSILKVK